MPGKYRYNKINWEKNNVVKIRNFTEAVDHHDMIKCLFVRMLRREHRSQSRVEIRTEEEHDNAVSDVWMRIDDKIHIWEIQKNINKEWVKKVNEKYEDVIFNIIPTKDLSTELNELKEQLKVYLI